MCVVIRTAITIPDKCWSKFRDVIDQFIDKLEVMVITIRQTDGQTDFSAVTLFLIWVPLTFSYGFKKSQPPPPPPFFVFFLSYLSFFEIPMPRTTRWNIISEASHVSMSFNSNLYLPKQFSNKFIYNIFIDLFSDYSVLSDTTSVNVRLSYRFRASLLMDVVILVF